MPSEDLQELCHKIQNSLLMSPNLLVPKSQSFQEGLLVVNKPLEDHQVIDAHILTYLNRYQDVKVLISS